MQHNDQRRLSVLRRADRFIDLDRNPKAISGLDMMHSFADMIRNRPRDWIQMSQLGQVVCSFLSLFQWLGLVLKRWVLLDCLWITSASFSERSFFSRTSANTGSTVPIRRRSSSVIYMLGAINEKICLDTWTTFLPAVPINI